MHLDELSQTPSETTEDPRGAGSCLHLGAPLSPRCKYEPAMLDYSAFEGFVPLGGGVYILLGP